MKVLKRSQITEVVTSRNVYHELELNGCRYSRVESFTSRIPYMDFDVKVSKPTVRWSVYVNHNTISVLNQKEIKVLRLNELFAEIDLNSRNGNG